MLWFVRSRGRVRGTSFVVRRPHFIRVSRGCRLSIGDRTVIEGQSRIIVEADLTIGDRTYVGKNVTLIAFDSLVLGADVRLGENVGLHTEDHGTASDRDHYRRGPIRVGDLAWLGAGVVVTRGVEIGSRSTVGANSVVTKDLPDDVLAVGAPARVVGQLSADSRP